jgi:tetratricopeptide (TPR) repeat protein
VAGYHPLVVGILQTVVEAATTVVIFEIAGQIIPAVPIGKEPGGIRVPRPQIVGAIAALGWIFFQPAQAFSVIVMPTCWMVLMFWGVVWYLLKMRRATAWNPWLWLGLMIGVMAMMVATVLFLAPLVIAAIYLKLEPGSPRRSRLPKLFAASALFLGGIVAGASPCAFHNYLIAHEPVFLSAHSGLNFYIGNNEHANGYTNIPPGLRAGQEGMLTDSILWAEKAEGRKLQRVEVSQYWSAKAKAYIHDHFADWLRLMCVKFKNFWNAYQYDDLSLVTMFAADGVITPGLRFGFIAALAIPGLFIAFRRYPRSRWVIAAIFLHMAALMPVFITERYRLAAVPGLLLVASIGLLEFWDSLLRRQWRLPALYLAGTAASVLFVTLPLSDGAGLWSLDYYNTGIKATENGNLDVAQKNLETAFEYVPENSEINFALGNLWLQKGNRALAKTFYTAATRMNARHGSAFNNLGYLALEDEQWEAATAYLKKSIEIDPDDAKVYYLLAKARLGAGDLPGADEAIKQALARIPGQKEFQDLAADIEAQLKK